MITPNQIREKKISTVEPNGYDRSEVNELLLEVIESYEAVYNENKELYRKMDVLANRIEEYRADEDSIKTALIIAQKMATKVTNDANMQAEKTIADSNASAHQTVVDAQEKADKIVGEAREYVASLTKEKAQAADEIVAEAEKKANDAINGAKLVGQSILTQAKNLADEIVLKAKAESVYFERIMSRLKTESKEFGATLTELYKSQLSAVEALVEPEIDTYAEDEKIVEMQSELDSLLASIADVVGEAPEEKTDEIAEPVQDDEPEEEAEEVEEIDEAEELEEIEEIVDTEEAEETSEPEVDYDEVDEIIEEIEAMEERYEDISEPLPTREEISGAIDAFSSDEITPVDLDAAAIPIIEDESEFESSLPFESFFNVKREETRTNETISLVPPDDDDDDDTTKFKGFFKKKK